MEVINAETALNQDGLCQRCGDIDWDGMAHAIKHYPIGRPTGGQRFHVFYIDTRVDDNEDVLMASGCRFCRLLAAALQIHGLNTPGQLDCVHDDSSMVSIQMETMTPALAVTMDDVPQAYKKFSREYANIKSLDYESIKASLHNCERIHVDCKPDMLDKLPGFRLIDCYTRAIVPAQSTINGGNAPEVPDSARHGYHYVALSYVWGPRRDESRIGASGALENLPQTIDDGIRFCKALGYRYLWVDRYVSALSSCYAVARADHGSASTKKTSKRKPYRLRTWEGYTPLHSSLSSPQLAKTLSTVFQVLPTMPLPFLSSQR